MEQLKKILERALKELYDLKIELNFNRPNYSFGDYCSNCSFIISKKINKTPNEIAIQIKDYIDSQKNNIILSTEVLNGFINFRLSDEILINNLKQEKKYFLNDQNIVIEYSDPNPFKMLHAGHLYTSIVGDSIANMLSFVGARVSRVNFGGDVGLHVAKNIWAMLEYLKGENPDKLDTIAQNKRQEWLNDRYLEGNKAFEDNPQSNLEIKNLNKKIYDIVLNNDKTSNLAKIFFITREWSYQYLKDFYLKLNITFDKFYPESEVTELGLETVRKHIPEVYTKSDNAIIFDGERYNLKTYVYITSEGLPTYSAKDVGLILKKYQDYNFDQSIIITANDQVDYLKNVLKSVQQFEPELANKTKHLSHGLVKLSTGHKMSSRTGQALSAQDVLDYAYNEEFKISDKVDPKIYISAIKYSFLKQKMGGDIIYNPKEAVAIEGNSGPYIQYSFVRANKIIEKSNFTNEIKSSSSLDKDERHLVYKISEFYEVLDKSINELSTHHICIFLHELAQMFNSFYESTPILGSSREEIRVAILIEYRRIFRNCFKILGLEEINFM